MKRRRRLLLSIIVPCALVITALVVYKVWTTPTVPSVRQVRASVTAQRRLPDYAMGGDLLARLDASGVAFDPGWLRRNAYQEQLITNRLVVDMLGTFSADQIEEAGRHSGKLPFSSLSHEQQICLRRLRWYSGYTQDPGLPHGTVRLFRISGRNSLIVSVPTKGGDCTWGCDCSHLDPPKYIGRPDPDVVSLICAGGYTPPESVVHIK